VLECGETPSEPAGGTPALHVRVMRLGEAVFPLGEEGVFGRWLASA
jgi:hypothetical protein